MKQRLARGRDRARGTSGRPRRRSPSSRASPRPERAWWLRSRRRRAATGRAHPRAADLQARRPTGRWPRPHRRRRLRAGAGGSGNGDRACRCRPARGGRCPRATQTCRPPRTHRVRPRRASRSCAARPHAADAARGGRHRFRRSSWTRLLIHLDNRRQPPYIEAEGSSGYSGGALHFITVRCRRVLPLVSPTLVTQRSDSQVHQPRGARRTQHGCRSRHHPRVLPDDHPGHLGHHRRAAEDPQRPRFLSNQPLLGAERLHADVRRPAPARSPRRRPPGPPPHARGRHLAVHRRIAGGRARAVGCVATGCAGRAGRRRGDRRAVDARAVDDDVPRGSRAHEGARVLQRGRGRRRQRRPRAGRCAHRLAVVALGAVHQRADRPRA